MPFEDFKIDPDTGDMVLLETGHFEQVRQDERIAQHIAQRLNTHKREWFLDLSAGPDWTGAILVKNPSVTRVRAEIASQIMAVADTRLIKSLTIDFDAATRTAQITFVVATVFGIVSGAV